MQNHQIKNNNKKKEKFLLFYFVLSLLTRKFAKTIFHF